DGIRDRNVTEFRRVLFRSLKRQWSSSPRTCTGTPCTDHLHPLKSNQSKQSKQTRIRKTSKWTTRSTTCKGTGSLSETADRKVSQIGRASCRERVGRWRGGV